MPLPRFLPIRVLDVWTHGQDVRRAIGAGRRLSGPATVVAVGQIAALLPSSSSARAWARRPGSSVAFDVAGDGAGGQVTVTVGADGRAASRRRAWRRTRP